MGMILRNRFSFSPCQPSGFRDLGLSLKEFQGIFFGLQGFSKEVCYRIALKSTVLYSSVCLAAAVHRNAELRGTFRNG